MLLLGVDLIKISSWPVCWRARQNIEKIRTEDSIEDFNIDGSWWLGSGDEYRRAVTSGSWPEIKSLARHSIIEIAQTNKTPCHRVPVCLTNGSDPLSIPSSHSMDRSS